MEVFTEYGPDTVLLNIENFFASKPGFLRVLLYVLLLGKKSKTFYSFTSNNTLVLRDLLYISNLIITILMTILYIHQFIKMYAITQIDTSASHF